MNAISQQELGSDTVTQGIRVRVRPAYMPQHSSPDERRFVFSYRVEIVNQSERTAQLLRRHWVIVDAEGEREEVKGEGVVGQQPRLAPGESHEYSSFCPLQTRWGTMEGSFTFQDEAGEEFPVRAARFYLVAPQDD